MTSYLDATTSAASEERPVASLGCPNAALHVVWSVDSSCIGRRAAIDHELMLVGREPSQAGLAVRDSRMSRVHARLYYDVRSGGMRIGDAQSRNGTFVNMRPVRTALLTPGDVVRVGNTVLVYEERDRMMELRVRAAAAARLTSNVLLRGESGTGKELLAQELHAQSGRSGAFVPINCGSIPIELLSSELFGHTKQAFSGATRPRKGVFLEAAGGTLFLDEIGDCPMPIQVALLRALQEKAVRPVGAEREIPVDVRVIAATHRDLDDAIEDGGFRADLYARLAQISLVVPPLRERRGEVLELIELFAIEHKHPVQLTADAVEALVCWDWPLNVRELQALVQALIVRGRASEPIDLVRLSDLVPGIAQQLRQRRGSTDPRAPSSQPPDEASARTQERQQLRVLLEAHGGNVSAVAQQLGRPRSQIYRWLKAMGFSANKFRR